MVQVKQHINKQSFEERSLEADVFVQELLNSYSRSKFGSTTYAIHILEAIKLGMIKLPNKLLWKRMEKYMGTHHLSLSSFIQESYLFEPPKLQNTLSGNKFDASQNIADLVLLLRDISSLGGEHIVIQDVLLYLYIIYYKTKNEALVASYSRLISSSLIVPHDLDYVKVDVILGDIGYLANLIMHWNRRAYDRRHINTPYYLTLTEKSWSAFIKAVKSGFDLKFIQKDIIKQALVRYYRTKWSSKDDFTDFISKFKKYDRDNLPDLAALHPVGKNYYLHKDVVYGYKDNYSSATNFNDMLDTETVEFTDYYEPIEQPIVEVILDLQEVNDYCAMNDKDVKAYFKEVFYMAGTVALARKYYNFPESEDNICITIKNAYLDGDIELISLAETYAATLRSDYMENVTYYVQVDSLENM